MEEEIRGSRGQDEQGPSGGPAEGFAGLELIERGEVIVGSGASEFADGGEEEAADIEAAKEIAEIRRELGVAKTSEKKVESSEVLSEQEILFNPEYLKKLWELDQEYIDAELDRKGEIVIPNAAVLSVDVEGFSTLVNRIHEASDRPGYASMHIAHLMGELREKITGAVHLFGGETDQFLGDGMNILFRGERAVERAANSAKVINHAIAELGEVRIGSITAPIRARSGISYGEVHLVGYGSDEEKRADMTGPAVFEAEAIQSKASAYDKICVTMSQGASGKLAEAASELSLLEKGVYSLDRVAGKDLLMPGEACFKQEIPTTPEDVREAAEVRERFLSKTRREEMRREFLTGYEPNQSRTIVSTVFVSIPELTGKKKDYEERDRVLSGIFETCDRLRGKVDKVHHDTVMINFIAGMNDVNSLHASLRIKEELAKAGLEDFKLASSRDEAFVLAIDGIRTVYGRSVVSARRLLDVENPGGGLVVDEQTLKHIVRTRATYRELTPVRVKGFEEPVKRYLVTEMEPAYLRSLEGKELVGREKELGFLRELYERAAQENKGQAVIIKGEQGVGKTALATEFLDRMKKEGVYAVAGRAEAYTQKKPFAVLEDMFEHAFALRGTDDITLRREVVQEFFENNQRADLVEKLALLNPILRTNFEESDRTKYLDESERSEEQAKLVVEILDSLTSIDRPAVVLLEDMQYWDKQSEELLTRVFSKLGGSKVFIAATTWPFDRENRELPPEELKREIPGLVEQKLGGLPTCRYDYDRVREELEKAEGAGQEMDIENARRAVAEMDAWWGESKQLWWEAVNAIVPLSREDFAKNEAGWRRIMSKIAHKTHGNFRYLEQIIYDLVIYKGEDRYFEEDEVTRDGKTEMFYKLGRRRIQDSVFTEIKEMEKLEEDIINSLGEEPASVLRDAAVVGAYFDVETLASLSKLPSDKIKEALRVAERYGFVTPRGEGFYEFRRGQDAAYNSIGDARARQLKHRRLANFFEGREPDNLPLLVRHFRNSDDYLKALAYLDKYAEQLKSSVLWGAALNQLRYADDIFEKVRQRKWEILDMRFEHPRSKKLSEGEIDQLVDDEVKRRFKAVSIWRSSTGDRKKALEILEESQTLFAENHPQFEGMEPHDQLLAAKFFREIGEEKTYSSVYDEALDNLKQAEGLLDKIEPRLDGNEELLCNYRELRADLYDALGWLSKWTRDYPAALEYYKKGQEFADDYDAQFAMRNGIAFSNKDLGNLDEARTAYESLLKLANREGDRGGIVVVSNNFAGLNARMGNLDKAEALYVQAIETAEKISKTTSIYYAKGGLAFIMRMKEDYGKSANLFQEAADFFESRGSVSVTNLANAELAFCLIQLGQFGEAKRALNRLRQSQDVLFQGRASILEAMIGMKSNGRIDKESIEKFNQGIELLRESNKEDSLAFNLFYFGELEIQHGRIEEGLAKVKEAKEIYERIQDLSEMKKIERILEQYEAVGEKLTK